MCLGYERLFKVMLLVCVVGVLLGHCAEVFGGATRSVAGPLRVSAKNPRYFADDAGKVVYLTGSHTWNNLVDMGKSDPPEAFDFDACLDWMGKLNHNFIRLWTWEPVTWNTKNNRRDAINNVSPQPWARTGRGKALDGKRKFDLSKFDERYFKRLRRRLEKANRRGIYVSVMLFEGWAMQFSPGAWEGHPFNGGNNVNGVDGDANGDGKGLEVHELVDEKVRALQEAYVGKVIDTVNDLNNVLYEISNENHPASTEWQYHMIRFIKGYEKSKAKQHPVGMTFQYKGGSNKVLYNSPADWVSPNHDNGRYRNNPPPADGRKVVLLDTDHLWGIGGNQVWVWKSFLRGHNPLFMDPYDGLILGERFDPKWEPVRRSLGHTRYYAAKMDLASMTPRSGLASTNYCLARPGAEYLVYRPSGKESFTVKLEAGRYDLEWFDPAKGAVIKTETLQAAGGEKVFKSPVDGQVVLYIGGK